MPEFDAPVAPAPVSDQPAVDLPSMSVGGPVAGKGPGWWSPLKSKVMALGQQVKAVQASVRPDSAPESHEGEIPTVMRSGAVAVPEEQVGTVLRPPVEAASGEGEVGTVLRPPSEAASGEDEVGTVLRPPSEAAPGEGEVGTVLRSPAEPGDPAASENEIGTVLRSPAELGDPAAVENQIGTVLRPPIRVSGATAVARPIPEAPKPGGKAAVAPVPLGLAEERMVLVERDPNELSLWDHYGIADDDGGVKLDPMATRTEQLAQLLGASTVPAVKVLSSAAVLGVTILVIIILSGRLLSMENLFAIVPATPTPTPTEVAPEPEPEPTPEPEPEPEPEGPVTPSMEPGAKECDPGVWAGQQTSCALANQVATQVGRDITETTVVEAFSSSSNRNYRLECVAGQGITCTGLDDVQGVYVWLVTEN